MCTDHIYPVCLLLTLCAERILQLARDEDTDPCIPPKSQTATDPADLQAAIKRGPEFFHAIPVTLRPIAPFIRVRPKIPRAIRQKVLDKLTGQRLAIEAVLMNHTDTSKEVLSPSSVAIDVALVKRSVAAAVEQEADMYGRCNSPQVYQNLAARCSALDWRTEVRAAAEAEKAYEDLLAMQRLEEERVEEEGEGRESERKRKRSKVELEDRNNIATIDDNPQLKIGKFTTTATAIPPNSKQQAPLVESDLEWNHVEPNTSENVQELRRRVIYALENCTKWSMLTVDQRVDAVKRCTLKVKERTGGGITIESIEDTALQRLAMQYIDFMIKKSTT
jgi:hypothetical protein